LLSTILHVQIADSSMSEPVDNEFPTIDDLHKRMDELAREIAAMPRDDPRRHDINSELTRLNLLAESMQKRKSETASPKLFGEARRSGLLSRFRN
jgi:hypothetical protein